MQWLRCKNLLKEGCIPLSEFDQLTNKRIDRIITYAEEQLELQRKFIEEERAKQEKEAARGRSKY